MAIERERGISVVTSVMTFEYGGRVFNLLDTPGHEDFSEDTYRTLTAVDSAVMVIDAAKGIEARTRKLFEVCRLRDIPIVTFINKMDRESRDPFDLLDEIEKTLALDTAPVTWPIGRGPRLRRHLRSRRATSCAGSTPTRRRCRSTGPASPAVAALLPENDAEAWREEIALAQDACRPFDLEAFREGPPDAGVLRLGAEEFRRPRPDRRPRRIAPPPRGAERRQAHRRGRREPHDRLRLQDPGQHGPEPSRPHRLHARLLGQAHARHEGEAGAHRQADHLSAPQFFFAQDRAIADEAYAGDVVGIPNHGTLRIGDTLTEGEDIMFRGVPSFAPEILRRIKLTDAMKAKKLREALQQMGEEGVVQVFLPQDGSPAIVGVVGALQLDVLKERLLAEYGLPIDYDTTRFSVCRWVSAEDRAELDRFLAAHGSAIADDLDGAPVFMATSPFSLKYDEERSPAIRFADVKDYQKRDTSPEGRGRVAPGGGARAPTG